jgi:hypothetical protein
MPRPPCRQLMIFSNSRTADYRQAALRGGYHFRGQHHSYHFWPTRPRRTTVRLADLQQSSKLEGAHCGLGKNLSAAQHLGGVPENPVRRCRQPISFTSGVSYGTLFRTLIQLRKSPPESPCRGVILKGTEFIRTNHRLTTESRSPGGVPASPCRGQRQAGQQQHRCRNAGRQSA